MKSCVYREVAQLGEHRMHTKVVGSSPTFLVIKVVEH